jgi:hypothetical protein
MIIIAPLLLRLYEKFKAHRATERFAEEWLRGIPFD